MGVNGIYGLSGSGLDVESMVKVGMLSKQSEYEKMQQKYTKDEWKKTEFLSLYGEVQTFNASTLSKYKMSSSMNSRSASSANTSSVTATANANAATMTHYVEVSQLASSAYLIGTKSPTRLNTEADQKTQLSSVLFNSLEAGTGAQSDTVTVKLNDADGNLQSFNCAMTDTAFSFSINDGVNGLLTSGDSNTVIASANPDAATGTYAVKVTKMATAPKNIGATLPGIAPDIKVFDSLVKFAQSQQGFENVSEADIKSYLSDNAETNTSTAIAFTVGDGTNSKEVSYSYKDVLKLVNGDITFADFIEQLNEKIGDTVNVKANISDEGELYFSNSKVGLNSKIIIDMDQTKAVNAVRSSSMSDFPASEDKFDSVAAAVLMKLVLGSNGNTGSNISGVPNVELSNAYHEGMVRMEISGTNAEFEVTDVTDENDTSTVIDMTAVSEDDWSNVNLSRSSTLPTGYTTDGTNLTYTDGNGVSVSVNGNDITFNGITITAKNTTSGDGIKITNDSSTQSGSVVSVTYRDLLDGFTFYDLTSKVNSMGLNVRLNYDSVQDRFSLYNKKSGEENQINIQIGTDTTLGSASQNAADFFNKLGLQQSSNGEITGEVLKFTDTKRTVEQAGVNAKAKVDGIEYNALDSNNVSVDGVTYNLTNVTEANQKVAVTVTQDTDTIIKNVESFVSDYNALLTKLYKWYDEKPNSDYKPLTTTQKENMKDEQIEKWEEKAKAGMLYHDQTLWKVISDLRSAVSENVGGVNGKYTNIFSLGVSTTGLKGQLSLDKDKLKAALADDPDAVYNVFAKLDGGEKQYQFKKTVDGVTTYIWSPNITEDGYEPVYENGKRVTKSVERSSYNGVAQRLGDIFMSGMKSIKAVSGTTASISEDSELNNLMRDLQTKMSNFKRMMAAFEERLYKKYDAMESSLALLGSQLNYVTSAFQ